MDSMMNADVLLLQHIELRQQTSAQKSASSEDSSFQKLMEQRQAESSDVSKEQSTETVEQAENTQSTKNTVEGDGLQEKSLLEEQMVLAAMAMMQNPVVYVDAAQQTSDLAAMPVVEQMVADTTESVAMVESADLMQGIQEVAEEAQGVVLTQQSEEAEMPLQQQTAESEQFDAKLSQESQGDDWKTVDETVVENPEMPVFEQTDEVLVKVGEAPVVEDTAAETPVGEQIGDKLVEVLTNEDNHVEIQLSPENLGRVSIDVKVDEDGMLHIELKAENSLTRSMLEKDSSGLQSLLMRNTEKTVQIEVQQEQPSQRQDLLQEQEQQSQHHSQQQQHKEEHRDPESFLQQLRLGLIPLESEEF